MTLEPVSSESLQIIKILSRFARAEKRAYTPPRVLRYLPKSQFSRINSANCEVKSFLIVTLQPICKSTSVFGKVLEWLKRHAWKACIRQKRITGSNPVLSAFKNKEPSHSVAGRPCPTTLFLYPCPHATLHAKIQCTRFALA